MNEIPSTVHPKVRERVNVYLASHAHCWQLDHSGPMTWLGFTGDVRRCRHGKLMVRTATTSTRVAGPGTDWWRTLHPLFTPIKYRRAKRALNA